MREIREKLCELAAAYDNQLNLYAEIEEVGNGERELIQEGNLAQLLEVLKNKESLLKQAGRLEVKIKKIQEQLINHFDLESFSLAQLKSVAPSYYQDELKLLEATVARLLTVLEDLEERERENESYLSNFLELKQGTTSRQTRIKLAGRAYGKGKPEP